MERIKVLLADDRALFRAGLRVILDRQEDIIVVGEAEDGAEAAQKAAGLAPDIVLVDIKLPVRDGVDAVGLIRAQSPQVGVIMLTVEGESEGVLEALIAGARGYIFRSAQAEELLETIRGVHSGGTVLNPGIMNTLLGEFRRLVDQSQGNAPAGLSEREARILGLVAQGKSNRDIADLLSLSEQTIKNRLSAIFLKLQVANRTEAATYAIQQGLISLE